MRKFKTLVKVPIGFRKHIPEGQELELHSESESAVVLKYPQYVGRAFALLVIYGKDEVEEVVL